MKKIQTLRYLYLFLLCCFCKISFTQNWTQAEKIVASDRATFDQFGYSVSISGAYAIVGAYGEDENSFGGSTENSAGSAYIFKKDSNGNWMQLKKIVASDRSANDLFGYSVAISGDYIVVGAMGEDHYVPSVNFFHREIGAAYIFKKDEGGIDNWGEVKKIVAADGASNNIGFGRNVDIHETYIIVGALGEGYDASGNTFLSESGAAYIFNKDEGGIDNWGQVRKLVANDRAIQDRFGGGVAINEDYAIVGAIWEDDDVNDANSLSKAGSVYVFKKDEGGANNWGQVKKIIADDRAEDDEFGNSLAIHGETIIVGCQGKDIPDPSGGLFYSVGAAYIFHKDEGGIDNWGQAQKIEAHDQAAYDGFGNSVSIDDNLAVIGSWANDADDRGDNKLGNAGAAYIFKKEGDWIQAQKIVATDRSISDLFGQSVAISGEDIIVGANEDQEDATGGNALTQAGSAYIFAMPCSTFPSFTGTVESLCTTEEINVTIQVTDVGSANSLEITANGEVVVTNAVLNQAYVLGPFENSPLIAVREIGNNACFNSAVYSINCNPSQIVKLYNFSEPHPSSIDGFGPRFMNLYEEASLPNTYNYFGTNFYSNDVHLWEFDGCQFTELYDKDYDFISENILDGRGNLIVYGSSKLGEGSFVFKYDGQSLTRFDNPPNYAYSSQFHLANSSTNNNYFIYFTGAGREQTYKIFYIDNNDILQEVANPTGYHPSVSLPLGTERGFADKNGNVFILYQKLDNEYDRIWGVHNGTSLTLLNDPTGGPFSLDFKGIASNGDVLFAGTPTPFEANVYKYNQSGLALVIDAPINSPPVGIDSELLGSDGFNDYFKFGDNGLVKYDGTTLTNVFPPTGTGSHFLTIDDYGTLWGYTFINDNSHLFTYDGTNYEIIGRPDSYNVSAYLLASNGLHFFAYNKAGVTFPSRLSTVGYYDGNTLQLIDNPVAPTQAQLLRIWKEETTGEVYLVFGNWGLYFNTDQTSAYYQSNQNFLYRFTPAGLEPIELPTAYSWFDQFYLLNGKSMLVLKPAYDADEMVLHTIESNVVTPLSEHLNIDRIHTPAEADYMLVSANDHQDIIKILPDKCDNTPCPATINITGDPIRIGYYQATKALEMDIESEALCKVVAGETITLKPGFHAKAGSEFLAQIETNQPTLPTCSSGERAIPLTENLQMPPAKTSGLGGLVVFPNPFSNNTTIQFTLSTTAAVSVQIFDVNGRLVKNLLSNEYRAAGRHQITLERNSLKVGVYYLNMVNEREQFIQKLMVIQ